MRNPAVPYENDTLSGFGYLSAAAAREAVSAAWSWAAFVGDADMMDDWRMIVDSPSSLFVVIDGE